MVSLDIATLWRSLAIDEAFDLAARKHPARGVVSDRYGHAPQSAAVTGDVTESIPEIKQD